MTSKLAFRFTLLAAIVMLAMGALMGVTAPACGALPMEPLLAFELARTGDDLRRIFGAAGEACRAPLAAQFDHVNLLDSLVYIPAYTSFYIFTLLGIGRRAMLARIGVALALICAIADEIENQALFRLSAAPDGGSIWLSVLTVATNIKWSGLGVVAMLGGVMLTRRGWWGWLAFVACVAQLGTALWALAAPDAAGTWLLPGATVAALVFLALALWGSFKSAD